MTNTTDLAQLQSPKKRLDDAPLVQGSVLIIADLQIPYQDGPFLFNLLSLAKAWGITQGISAGDFFNESAFSPLCNKATAKDWEEEARVAGNVYSVMQKYVPNWLFLLGNHDAYILHALENQITHKDVLTIANIDAKSTNYYWCTVVDHQGNMWRVSHPKNTSTAPIRIPQLLSRKFKMNIIAGHGHLSGMSPDDSGDYCCIDTGICCDPDRLDYATERDNTRPKMTQGAVILKEADGILYPYHILPKWTDWGNLRRLYKETSSAN